MTDERTKFEAWATLRGFGMKKVPAEGKRYVSDTTQAAWEGYQAAVASQQKPVFIDRDGEYIPPLSDRERATKFGEAIAKGLSQIGKPVPAGLDEVAEKVWRERAWLEKEFEMKLDHCHRASCVQIIEALRAKVEELTATVAQCREIELELHSMAQRDGRHEDNAIDIIRVYQEQLNNLIRAVDTDYEQLYREATEQLAAKDAVIERLREACQAITDWDASEKTALPFVDDGGAGFYRRVALCDEAMRLAAESIAIPNDDSALEARLAQEYASGYAAGELKHGIAGGELK